jgi:hypothetical protein
LAELADEYIVNMERPNHIMKKPTLISFDFNSQERTWTESRNQAKLEVTEPNNPIISHHLRFLENKIMKIKMMDAY